LPLDGDEGLGGQRLDVRRTECGTRCRGKIACQNSGQQGNDRKKIKSGFYDVAS